MAMEECLEKSLQVESPFCEKMGTASNQADCEDKFSKNLACTKCENGVEEGHKFCWYCGCEFVDNGKRESLDRKDMEKEMKKITHRNALIEGILTASPGFVVYRQMLFQIPGLGPQRILEGMEGMLWLVAKLSRFKDSCVSQSLITNTSPALSLMLGRDPQQLRGSHLAMLLPMEEFSNFFYLSTRSGFTAISKLGIPKLGSVSFRLRSVYCHADKTMYAILTESVCFLDQDKQPDTLYINIRHYWKLRSSMEASSLLFGREMTFKKE